MSDRPNLLIMMTDQQRFDALGCAGNGKIRTPNLDRLAAQSVRFSNACCPTPICVASRMSLITGQRASVHHWTDNRSLPGPPPELLTIMTLLQGKGWNGYHTHAVGKMHFFMRHYGLETYERMHDGFIESRIDDDYLRYLREQCVRSRHPHGLRDLLYYQPQTIDIPEEHSPTTWVTRQAVKALRDHAHYRRRPLFLWISWTAPHPPFAPPEPYDTIYDLGDMDLPVFTDRPIATLPSTVWPHRARLDGAHLDPDRMRRIRALYYGRVTHVDDGVGQIVAELKALDLWNNTVILFVSDHGDMLGDHGLSQKSVPYEASIRVPMMLRWPGRTEEGRICDDLVSHIDFLPTLIQELDLPYPDDVLPPPGMSLLSEAGGGLDGKRDGYFVDYGRGRSRWICLRTHKHKYALWADGGMEELYDLEKDPHETHNILAEEPEIAREMRGRVLVWEREHGLASSFDGTEFCTYPRPKVPDEEPRGVVINETPWPDNLPEDEQDSVVSYAEAFTRVIAKETTLSPDKLSLADYKRKGGKPLTGTPWEDEWRSA